MSKVSEAIQEIDAALTAMADPLEGLNDYNALDLHPETKAQVQAAIGQYEQRKSLLTTARERLVLLVDDGYPVLEIPPVSLSVQADLEDQQRTIEAALSKFHTNAATDIGVAGGTVVPK